MATTAPLPGLGSLGSQAAGRSVAPGPPRLREVPALREDLALFPAAPNRDGSPAWMIQDPVTNRFFRIGWVEFELLSRWALRDPARILRAVGEETPLTVDADDLTQLIAFFRQHQLLRASDSAAVDHLRQMAERAKASRWQWLLHNYLFFRIPLVRPQRALQALAPWLGRLYSRPFFIASVCAAVLGLALAARQWDVFVHTFADYLSPQGLLGYAAALFFAKTLHELGHAITATRRGVRVAHMGIAFLVMWPMLYTDTGESWKLADRRQRFEIAAAGVASEFALAGFATLAWSLVDDGAMRSALFFLATTSWVLTLGINASPFMRFDGYFLLSDALDLQNLHARSFALARVRLRRWLLGWQEPDPEHFEPGLRRFLIGFAFVTWIYRLVVFLGIAVAVYHYFFKLLGIFLFAVEIAWFVVRPLWSELKVWVEQRSRVPRRRVAMIGAVLGLLLGLLAWPWARSIHGEGWLHAEQQQVIYSPFPARLAMIRGEGPVKLGETLIVLDSPDTRSKAGQSRILAESLALQFDQTVGRSDGAERRTILAEQLAQQLAELGAQQAELQRLELSAPFAGRLLDIDPDVRRGVWITANQPIAILIDPTSWVVDCLVEQRSLERLRVGSPVRFYRRNRFEAPFEGEVAAVDSARALVLPHPMLATDHGGRVPSTKQSNGALVPRDTLYRVRVKLREPADGFRSVQLGTAVIEGERRSVLADAWTAVAAILVRESGF
jgi:putative peptide zinc metalloprotease protein